MCGVWKWKEGKRRNLVRGGESDVLSAPLASSPRCTSNFNSSTANSQKAAEVVLVLPWIKFVSRINTFKSAMPQNFLAPSSPPATFNCFRSVDTNMMAVEETSAFS